MLLVFWASLVWFQDAAERVDLCDAADRAVQMAPMTLRGVGGVAKEGPLLFDYTCSVASGNDFVLPTVVLIEDVSFSSEAIAAAYRELSDTSLFQAVVRGRLQCRTPLRVRKADDGDITNGNGFGPLGLYRCRLRSGEILELHRIQN